MDAEGHELYGHTWKHEHFADKTEAYFEADFFKTKETLEKVIGH